MGTSLTLSSSSTADGAATTDSGCGAQQRLRVWLLGEFRIQVGLDPVRRFDRPSRAASLLKMLALAPGQRRRREELVEVLWPELELESGVNNLHAAIFHLRRMLEPDLRPRQPSDFVTIESDLVRLQAPAGLYVDFEHFMELSSSVISQFGLRTCDQALQLYGGGLLPNDRSAEWAAADRYTAREQFLCLLVLRAQNHVTSGEYWEAVRRLDQAVTCKPTHQQAHHELIRLYGFLGFRHLARRQYRQLQTILQRDLDAEPKLASTRPLRNTIPDRTARSLSHLGASRQSLERLSRREREVLLLLAEGHSNRAIGTLLSVSTRTVEVHVSHVLRKLGANSRHEVVVCMTEASEVAHERAS